MSWVSEFLGTSPKPAKYDVFVPEDMKGTRAGALDLLRRFQADPQGFVQQYFGNMGSPLDPLQQQTMGLIGQSFNQTAPEVQALQQANPFLLSLLQPGAAGLGQFEDLMRPAFQRNLAQANQQGGRFGSGNALMRGNAVTDFNALLGNQINQQAQQGLSAANLLGQLAGQAGQNPFQRLMGGFGIGQAAAGQADLETQRRLQFLQYLTNAFLETGLGSPVVQTQQGRGAGGFIDVLNAGAGAAKAYTGMKG